jgi:hypothetical protein
LPVEDQGAPKHAAVSTEALLPEAVCQDHHTLAALAVFLFQECAAHRGRHAEKREKPGRHQRPLQPFRLCASGPREHSR